nr:integrator complex subunit 7-like [Ciona intestinalis]|eukprot:XP_026693429.1 integrator complex subunit 7-like [Ciona intestinalis]
MDDHQQDANSALMELDKGLRAHKLGERCEAIVRFPNLFSRFPFPILINSAFLKLADAFRTGNNFLKLCVLRVAHQSTKHLDKILNVDEFMCRLYSVIHSNDPYARAITLRMLGSVACIIKDKKNAHHSIQQGLDSHDRVEQDAAIYATIQFASHSHQFASSICNKIAAMLQGLSTPLEVKLKLIPVLQHMHYDVQISSKARSVLQNLLPSFPAQDFVLTTLNTLTSLSLHSLIDVSSQVALLHQYLRCDPREALKRNSLINLNVLASKAPHLWRSEDSSALCEAYKLSTLADSLKQGILQVLCTLTDTTLLVQLDIQEDGSLVKLCRQCCYDADLIQAALATRLFVSISNHALHSNEHNHAILATEAMESAETLLLTLAPSSNANAQDKRALKIILPTLQHLSCDNSEIDVRLAEDIMCLLSSEEIPICSDTSKILLETLASLVTTSSTPNILHHLTGDLFKLLKLTTEESAEHSNTDHAQKNATLICVLLFGANNKKKNVRFSTKLLDTIETPLNNWTLYRIARQASRLGQHEVAHSLFKKVSNTVASEHHYFWLTGLADLAFAESTIKETSVIGQNCSDKTVKNLHNAIHWYPPRHYIHLRLLAAVTPNHPLTFQCEYARLRNETLQAHAQLLSACSLIRTCPPSAAAASPTGKKNGDQNEILITRMKACADWFMSVETGYSNLHMTSFDSDPKTLLNIDQLQQIKTSIFLFSIHLKLTDCLAMCSSTILSVPHSFPRYFYQSLQTTSIKLAISPSQRGTSGPVNVEINQQFTLKVEGVIQHVNSTDSDVIECAGDRDETYKKFREVARVKLSLRKTKQGQAKVTNTKVDEGKSHFVQTVNPRNDYFSTQFLVNFPLAGIYMLHIETNVEDGDGVWWKTGPKETVLVKAYDDSVRIQQQTQQSQARSTPTNR